MFLRFQDEDLDCHVVTTLGNSPRTKQKAVHHLDELLFVVHFRSLLSWRLSETRRGQGQPEAALPTEEMPGSRRPHAELPAHSLLGLFVRAHTNLPDVLRWFLQLS